jgi:hypothetical protein
MRMMEVSESSAIARFRFAEIADTIVYLCDLVEGGLCCQTLHRFNVV